MITIAIPQAAREILNTLHQAGYEAYIVGGCVRDALLKRQPDDWDITTNADPITIKQLFSHTVDTGLQHGTVTVLKNKTGYEVTTYRVDGAYKDHRRPDKVTFTSDLKEDMLRRDFTINAMAYNEEEGLVDHFHGQEDLKRGIIRCVGEAAKRFDEDALRVLRALRFAAQLDFQIEEATLEAMKEKAVYLKEISAERIRVELTKLLCSEHPECLLTIGYPVGITALLLPWFDDMLNTPQENPHHCYDVGRHTMKAVCQVDNSVVLRFAALLHDVGKPKCKTVDAAGVAHFYEHGRVGAKMAGQILRELKFDNDTIRRVRELVYWHDYNWGNEVSRRLVRRAASKIGVDYMKDLFALHRADVLAQSQFLQIEKLQLLDAIKICYSEIEEEQDCITIKQLAIGGQELIAAGMKPGREIGDMLQYLLEQVIEQPEWNTRDKLLELVEQRRLS